MARPIDRVSGYGTCGLQTYLRLSVTELRRSFITPREVNSGYGTGGKLEVQTNLRLSSIELRKLFILSRQVSKFKQLGLSAGQKPSDIMLHSGVRLAAIFSIRRMAKCHIEKIST